MYYQDYSCRTNDGRQLFFSFNETLKMYTNKYFINNFGSFSNIVIRFEIGL